MGFRLRFFLAVLSLSSLAVLAAVPALAAPARVRVPQDAGLQAAIQQVADGGVIEIAAGRYPSPNQGFDLANLRKAFTLRAAAGATVVLDGGGARPILRLRNGQRSRGKLVSFEGITFEGAGSTAEIEGGAVSLAAAEARFVNCRFLNNSASGPSTGGGAVGVTNGSDASFFGCEWRGNRSRNRAGALAVIDSTVLVQGGSFVDNRVNLPGHSSRASGGAILALESVVRLAGVRFEGNQAAYAGGALYAFGTWRAPEGVPHTDVLITDSTFLGNRAEANPCCRPPGPTAGGAIHAEDQATVRVRRSRFADNVAEQGGAIDTYRAEVLVDGSVFQGNRAPDDSSVVTAGGAIFAASADFADSSTNGGAVNRRPARVEVRASLLQGVSGAASTVMNGGCLFAAGDSNRLYGEGGVAKNGTAAANRAQVVLEGDVFADCDAQGATPAQAGVGGAIYADLADLTMTGGLVVDSDALGSGATGGGASIRRESVARIAGTIFAHDSAEQAGGALHVGGSDLTVAGAGFFNNEVSPGVAEATAMSLGAAIFTIPLLSPSQPDRARPATGVISSSTFSANVGLPLWEVEPASGPASDMHYDANRFYATALGGLVYGNNGPQRTGASVAQLNGLADKVRTPNTRLTSPPAAGALVAIAPAGEPQSSSGGLLGFAWSGRTAVLSGPAGNVALPGSEGIVAGGAGSYRLLADGAQVGVAAVLPRACTDGPSLCLGGGRFRAEVRFKDFQGHGDYGRAVMLTPDTGTFWFFSPANLELVVKVLDARTLGGFFWVFSGALSSVEYTLVVTDLQNSRVRTYFNRSGQLASIADTTAFPAAAAAAGSTSFLPAADELAEEPEMAPDEGAAVAAGLAGVEEEAMDPTSTSDEATAGTCVPGARQLCLNGGGGAGRFRLELAFKDFQGKPGTGQAVALTSDTGYFWFFNQDNVEVVVKVIDGRLINGSFWIFYGALTTVEYTLTVTDTVTGRSKVYRNASGNLASVADTEALPSS